MKHKLLIFIILKFNFIYSQYTNQELGETCYRSSDNAKGICTYSDVCDHFHLDVKNRVPIITCQFGSNPIVCCIKSQKVTTKTPNISSKKCDEYKKLVLKTVFFGSLNANVADQVYEVSDCKHNALSLIVGGEKTVAGEFPHMASLGKEDFDGTITWTCGGSLISDKYVLTAAHCFKTGLIVRLGDQNLNKDDDGAKPQQLEVANFIKHPEYKIRSKYHDIALVEMNERAKFTDFVRPACLWQGDDLDQINVSATGWGMLKFAGATSEELQKVSLKTMNNNECKPFFTTISMYDSSLQEGITDNQLCAANIEGGKLVGGKDTCQGDSGGPIQVNDKENKCIFHIVGVTSFSVACGFENSPGVYTRVSNYLDWIESIVWADKN